MPLPALLLQPLLLDADTWDALGPSRSCKRGPSDNFAAFMLIIPGKANLPAVRRGRMQLLLLCLAFLPLAFSLSFLPLSFSFWPPIRMNTGRNSIVICPTCLKGLTCRAKALASG